MVGGVNKHRLLLVSIFLTDACCLRAFTTDSAGELNVLGHDGYAFCVDGGKIGVLEESH